MRITIIIPTYNSERYISDAINSVIQQTYKNIEVIIVDDGSTDNTKYLLKKYENNRKISYIKKENGGPASARNLGIKKSTGKYIALLDSDDVWDKNKLKKQIDFMNKNNFDLVYTDRFFINEPNKTEWISKGDKDVLRLIKENYIVNSSILIKADILKKNFFNEDKKLFAIEDYDLWLKLAFMGYNFGHLKEKLTGYRTHSNQISSKKNITNLVYLYKNKIKYTYNLKYKIILIYMYLKMTLYNIMLKFK